MSQISEEHQPTCDSLPTGQGCKDDRTINQQHSWASAQQGIRA